MKHEHTLESLMAMARGFMESRVLLTAPSSISSPARPGALALDEVLARAGGQRRAMTVLLDALVALGLLTKTEGR